MAVTLIERLRWGISADQFELSKHAVDHSIVRHIGMQELREAAATGEVIEDYPDDKYGPGCLVFGENNTVSPWCAGTDTIGRKKDATLGRDPRPILEGLICGLGCDGGSYADADPAPNSGITSRP